MTTPCPVIDDQPHGKPHVCLWWKCKLNIAKSIFDEGVKKFSKEAMTTTLRGFYLSAKDVDRADGNLELFPDDPTFCRCNVCCRAVILCHHASVPAFLQMLASLKEVLSRQ